MTPVARLANASDSAFLFDLFRLGRAPEFAGLAWSAEQLDAFLRQQFDFQQKSFAANYPVLHDEIVEVAGTPVGRVLLAVNEEAIVVVDLALLPEFRGGGIGTQVLQRAQTSAQATGHRLELQVRYDNPAQQLYERLGFCVSADNGVVREMRWVPLAVGAPA